MKAYPDAFGAWLLSCFRGATSPEIVERSDGYIDAYTGDYFAPYARWPVHQRRAIKYARGRILDIGAGAGRVALYLQRKGCKVLATDISPLAIRVCKLRGVKNARVIPITGLSPRLGNFETIIMYGNNFGLFGSFERARLLLRRFHAMTSPDARLIVESNDVYKTRNPDHLAYQRYNRLSRRMSGQISLRIRYKKIRTPWIDYLMVSREEMQTILKGTGWKVEKFFGSKGPMYAAVIKKEENRALQAAAGAARTAALFKSYRKSPKPDRP